MIFTGVLAGVAFLQFIAMLRQEKWMRANTKISEKSADAATKAAYAAQYSADAAKWEFIASHRPKLRIRNIDIHQTSAGDVMANGLRVAALPTVPLFKPGDHVTGQLYISNVGDSNANITEVGCWVKWMQGTLPMSRPYEGENGNVLDHPILDHPMEAGQTHPIHFRSDTPMGNEGALVRQCSNGWHIYVMGWVEYVDKLNTRRRTAFCREYRMPEGRFFAVTDPDYEHEE